MALVSRFCGAEPWGEARNANSKGCSQKRITGHSLPLTMEYVSVWGVCVCVHVCMCVSMCLFVSVCVCV